MSMRDTVEAFAEANNTFNGTALSLLPNWTVTPPTLTNAGNQAALAHAKYGFCQGDYWYPYYRVIYHGPWGEYRERRPVKLTMDEVERLRVAAKKDMSLGVILEKFTGQIEVIVDFGNAA